MNSSKPDEQHRRLNAFAGEWVGNVKIPPNPQLPEGAIVKSHIRSRIELGGWFLLSEYEQEWSDGRKYSARGVLGWDTRQERYAFYWFDSDGWDAGCPALGSWESDALRLQQKTYMGHNRLTFLFTGEDAYSLKMEYSEDGENWSAVFEESFKRVEIHDAPE